MTSDKSTLASTPGSEAGADSNSMHAGSALLTQSDPQSSGNNAPPALRRLSEDLPLASLPMQLDVSVPVSQFRVHNLLALEKGAVLESRWIHTEDVPVWCGGEQLVWAEFEVVGQKLAVRVTRIG